MQREPCPYGTTPLPCGLILGRETAPRLPREPMGYGPATPPSDKKHGRGGLISYGGDGHLITFAPTGTGKTVGPVICNCLMHPGQLIVLDIKGEVYRATARRRREMGQPVHVLDVRDGTGMGDSLNPLDLAARCGTEPASVARGFAAELIEPMPGERDRFWNNWAETMLTGGLAWLMEDCAPEQRTLAALFDLFTHEDVDFSIGTLLDKKITSRAAKAAFASYLNLPDRETRPSVLASTLQHLRLFDSELVRRATSSTSIDLDALARGDPMTLYIIVPPARLTALRPILRAWLSGLMLALTQRETPPRHSTLFLCDEIAQLGKIDSILTASTLMRGYGMQLWSIWQNVSQLAFYGEQARTILDNAGVVQLFGARNRRMAEEFVQLVGGTDADAIMAMRKDDQLLLIEGGALTECRRVRYFEEPEFAGLYDDRKPQAAALR